MLDVLQHAGKMNTVSFTEGFNLNFEGLCCEI